ncbi:ABC transporter permease [Reinekea marinisedimentorum]|uniref:Putative spermidine/putrescine transport system permease protein n=1 Tax=Reinekea marinisedimentorum TaxID=230495 RepID=A0A4R3HZW3_9GAMM|nr:ABC transporter permease [Reinekea marinisedimentorum]TCS38798.1 putative spermidine/putrescine transport system permease protein [Reinekea marinisedimentorum]
MNKEKLVIFLPSLCLIVVLVFIPLLMLAQKSLSVDGTISFANYLELFGDSTFKKALKNTFSISFFVVFATLLIGLPTAYFISRTQGRLKNVLLLLTLFPLLTNAVVRSISWMIILGYDGILSRLMSDLGLIDEPISLMYSKLAVIIGSTYIFLPLMIVSLIGVMDNISQEIEDASISLGASRLQTFFNVIIPNSMAGIIVGVVLVFTATLTAYTTPNILGGTRTVVLATLVQQYGTTLGRWELVSSISIFLFALTVVVITLINKSASLVGGRNEEK